MGMGLIDRIYRERDIYIYYIVFYSALYTLCNNVQRSMQHAIWTVQYRRYRDLKIIFFLSFCLPTYHILYIFLISCVARKSIGE